MNFARKIEKLFEFDIFLSTCEHLRRVLHPVDAGKLWSELESDPSWEELRRRFPPGEKRVHRFGDTKFWIERNVERAQDLSLDRPLCRHILDLGCGPGFFLYVAGKLGHSGVGIDIDVEPIFRETLRLLHVQRIVQRIGPGQRLPTPERKFDLITSYLTCFHRLERAPDGDWQLWSPHDWQFFIDDVRANQLAPGGTLLLEFHPQRDGKLYSKEVRTLFLKNNARLFRSKVFFQSH
jgi:SAM-dependent methyltransferase